MFILAALAAGLAVFAVMLGRAVLSVQPAGLDFLPMWTGARVAAQDPALLYDAAHVTRAQAWLLGDLAGARPFPYPPSALLVFGPLGRLAFWPSFGLWTGVCVAAFCAAGAPLATRWTGLFLVMLLATPAAVSGMVAGQSVFLVGALALLGLLSLARRPWLAGALVGVAAAIKPSLLVAAPLLLAVAGQWKALAAATLAGAAMVAASAAVYGVDTWRAWLSATSGFQAQVLGDPRLLKLVASPAGALHRLGLGGWRLGLAQGVIAAASLALGAFAYRRASSARARMAAMFGAGLMVTPYAMNYDTVVLAPAVIAGLVEATRPRDRVTSLATLAALVLAGFPWIGTVALAGLLGALAIRETTSPRTAAAAVPGGLKIPPDRRSPTAP